MIGNIKEIFLPKTGMQEKQLLQDPGYVGGVEGPCCMLQGCMNTMSKVSKEIKYCNAVINKYLRLQLRLLFVMSEVSKALYTYMNRMKPLYIQILQWLPHYLIRSRSHCNSNFNLQ